MILMNDFKAEPQSLKNEMNLAVQRVIDSGWFVLGKEVENFEGEFALACSLPYAVGVGNGMDAIEIILRALDIGPGDEVITTSMTAFATVLAIMRAGATPILADIDAHTGIMSLESARRCLSKKTKAVVLVHLYGQVNKPNDWVNFCKENSIFFIEDCAQSHLAQSGSVVAGGFGVAGAYSFYPTKNLGALGDGGMLVTSNKTIYEKALKLRNYGQSERYHHPILGMNSRLDEIQAAILGVRLKLLKDFTLRRRQIAKQYFDGITNSKITLLAPPNLESEHVYHLFVILCDDRDTLINHLKANDIQSLSHYPVPIHIQPPCLDLGRDPIGLKASEKHARSCLSIPCHPQISDDDVSKIIQTLNSF
jgi:dTDP-4-amino-4,6-dideoxygalactose transaminase